MALIEPGERSGIAADVIRKLDALGFNASVDPAAAEARYRAERALADAEPIWDKLNSDAGSTFSEVFQFELEALRGKLPIHVKGGAAAGADGAPGPRERSGADADADYDLTLAPADLGQVLKRAHGLNLSGLAYSGGGIRSATFNLGVTQALAELRMLREFDYLSTVSGGGYIGAWLSKYIKEKGGSVEAVEEELAPRAQPSLPNAEPSAVQFLRQYSNYLTPKTGLFSADTWTLLSTYVRNTLLNLTMLVAWLSVLLLTPRLLAAWVGAGLSSTPAGLMAGAIALFLLAVFFIALSISRTGPTIGKGWFSQTQGWILLTVCTPLMAAAFCGSLTVWTYRHAMARFWHSLPASLMVPSALWLLAPGALYFVVWSLGWLTAQYRNKLDAEFTAAGSPPAPSRAERTLRRRQAHIVLGEGVAHGLCAIGALGLGTILLLRLVAFAQVDGRDRWHLGVAELVTLGMPFMLILFALSVTLMIGLIGRMFTDQSREWWARQAAWTAIMTAAWLLVCCSVFYLPPLLHWAFSEFILTTSAAAAVSTVLTFLGLRSGSSARTSAQAGAPAARLRPPARLELAAQAAPYAFSLLIVGALSVLLQSLVTGFPLAVADGALISYIRAYTTATVHPGELVTLFLIGVAAALLLGWRVDINKFSLYMMYRLRLVRAYFGATSKKRTPHPFTGFDPADDVPLSSLLVRQAAPGEAPTVQRPYHILNCALNLVGGDELAWQSRKAANFVMTPAFCGFETPVLAGADRVAVCRQRGAFRPTTDYASDRDDADIRLGAAVAVSGAAASPNMGYHSSPPLNFLMTLFNLRLGCWSPNPMKRGTWRRASPHFGLLSILAELFGLTDMKAKFLYLSDGGHFENLGLYELVRRRCRLIVVVDASADAGQNFDDLGNAIRKCRTDFNIPIALDARKIQMRGDAALGANCVMGRVQYSHADGVCSDGLLMYIKPMIVGNENADVLNYSRGHPDFPHQSTADQWFEEDQFESYRALGYATARSAFDMLAHPAETPWDRLTRPQRVERVSAYLQGVQAPV